MSRWLPGEKKVNQNQVEKTTATLRYTYRCSVSDEDEVAGTDMRVVEERVERSHPRKHRSSSLLEGYSCGFAY
jgi:hypothetical protein